MQRHVLGLTVLIGLSAVDLVLRQQFQRCPEAALPHSPRPDLPHSLRRHQKHRAADPADVELPVSPEAQSTTPTEPLDRTTTPPHEIANAALGRSTGGAAPWLVPSENAKTGAGVLFFAYGATLTLERFVREASTAAASFRRLSPRVQLAIVSNNGSVDRRIFDVHLQPRADLLFAGDTDNGGQKRGDGIPRQWLTRLYYIAHSPYAITWALDSNVVSCTEGSAQLFLDAAAASGLWGFDIAHASQSAIHPRRRGKEPVMYPHNFNIVYKWSARTSALMRDWFLLQLEAGVAADDQKTLHLAELRHKRSVRVGRIAPAYAAALYFTDLARRDAKMSPPLRGGVHVLHTTDSRWCAAFNAHPAEPRRMLLRRLDPDYTSAHTSAHTTANTSANTSANASAIKIVVKAESSDTLASWLKAESSFTSYVESATRRPWVLGELRGGAACRALLPTKGDALCWADPAAAGAAAGAVAGAAAGDRADGGGAGLSAAGEEFVLPARLEHLKDYVRSGRCGAVCVGGVHAHLLKNVTKKAEKRLNL